MRTQWSTQVSAMPKKHATEAKAVKQDVKKLLDLHEWFWWMPPENGFGKSGIADFNALHSGVFMAIETKVHPRVPSVNQIAYLNSVRAEDGFGFLVYPEHLECLEAFLAAFERSKLAVASKAMPRNEDGAIMLNAIKEMTNY